jgi:hypothetical protein
MGTRSPWRWNMSLEAVTDSVLEPADPAPNGCAIGRAPEQRGDELAYLRVALDGGPDLAVVIEEQARGHGRADRRGTEGPSVYRSVRQIPGSRTPMRQPSCETAAPRATRWETRESSWCCRGVSPQTRPTQRS